MERVGILNVTGYAGTELVRLLYRHPAVKLTSVTGRSAVGQTLGRFMPHLSDLDLAITDELGDVDIAFSALPHKASAEAVIPLLEKGVKVIDLSADFRLKDAAEYQTWYEFEHPSPDLLKEAVYGLTEITRQEIAGARLVATPGCYPTGAILALAPAVKDGLIQGDIVIDGKSGVSGAGRTLSLSSHFAEVNENVSAYSVEGHRHFPEITQELERLNSGEKLSVTFLTHLIPMTRGIFSSCYAPLARGKLASGSQGKQELRERYQQFYRDEPFVEVVETPPGTKQTLGNNVCLVYPTVDERTGRLVVLSCLDNLVKGAAGQAIQNMNVMLGLPETMGLEAIALYP